MRTWARLSPDRIYRYELGRSWDPEKGRVAWVLHNPSTADEKEDDPTIRRVIGFTREWGYGEAVVINPMAFRASKPEDVLTAEDPVGPGNVGAWQSVIEGARLVVVGWGAVHRKLERHTDAMAHWLEVRNLKVRCLGTTKKGQPRHPLYLPRDAKLLEWPCLR